MMKKELVRNTRTRRALIEAFRTLVNQKEYSKITVREIAELAEVNRNSFYNHFRNIDDLLNDVVVERLVHCYVSEDGIWYSWDESKENLISFFEENRDFLPDVFRGDNGYHRSYFYDICMTILEQAEQAGQLHLPYGRQIFLAGGVSAMLTDWLFCRRSITTREFADVLYRHTSDIISMDNWEDSQ
jgi:AcrR family transcriptional regulator